jgi:hypothetical protein
MVRESFITKTENLDMKDIGKTIYRMVKDRTIPTMENLDITENGKKGSYMVQTDNFYINGNGLIYLLMLDMGISDTKVKIPIAKQKKQITFHSLYQYLLARPRKLALHYRYGSVSKQKINIL